MKSFIIGALSMGFIVAGGVSGVQAASDEMEMPAEGSEQMMEMDEMHQEVLNSNGVINFGQAKKLMENMHPEWTKEEIKNMYQSMHGTNGAAPSANLKK
ncbi:hypothetical protein ACGTN9_17290 [Halobacillus sp. MO56]